MRDAYHKVAKGHLLKPAQISSTTKSNYIDIQGFEAALIAINLGVGANLDAGDYYTFKVQESDTTTDGDFSNVASADLIGDWDGDGLVIDADDEDEITKLVSYIGAKRYIRIVATETSDTANGTLYVGIIAILSRARHDDPASGITPTVAAA